MTTATPSLVTASQLYAITQNTVCEGDQECHWCFGPCTREIIHDDSPPVPFLKSHSGAKRPGNPWMCRGCSLWRRRRSTCFYLSGGLKDGQIGPNHSWWLTPEGIWSITSPEDKAILWRILLNPPRQFVLALTDGKVPNHLHFAILNSHVEVIASTPLAFSLNNIALTFSPYELEQAVLIGADGKEPGTRLLMDWLGKPPEGLIAEPPPKEQTRERGRPTKGEENQVAFRKVVRVSGG